MALEIVSNPNSTAGQKAAAGAYIAGEAAAHAALVVGVAGLACSAVVGCAKAVEAGLGIGTAACADGNCANEGEWILRNEYMSDAARAYQELISGRPDGKVYKIGGYTFDGFDAGLGILKDAKHIPTNFINTITNEFQPWVSGTKEWLTQAQNQINAAGGLRIQWFFDS